MMSFNAVHALTECFLDTESTAEAHGWSHPPFLLLIQDRPAPSAANDMRRQMRIVHLWLNDNRLGRYRAGLADFLPELAATLAADRPVGRPTLAACVDVGLIVDLLADPTPGLRLLAWAVCYEDVLATSDGLHEIRRIDAVDADRRGYQIVRLRGEPHAVALIDEQLSHDDAPATRPGLVSLVQSTRPGRPTPTL
jgi:hypothetical protein